VARGGLLSRSEYDAVILGCYESTMESMLAAYKTGQRIYVFDNDRFWVNFEFLF